MEGGDATAANAENLKNRPRPTEDDEDKGAPAKVMKLTEETNEEDSVDVPANESDVDLGEEDEYEEISEQQPTAQDTEEDEEQLDLEADYAGESDQPGPEFDEEFEEGDTYDEEEEEVGLTAEEIDDTVQEEADSSADMQEFVQANLVYIEDCQSDIDNLNHKANEEILLVELKYNKLRLPVYKRRNTYIERVPNFWATVFSRHRQLRQVLTKEDIKCLNHVVKLQVEDFEDNRAGHSIQFYFNENPWFENKVITKEYHLPWNGRASCTCTPIAWKKGMNLTMKSSSFFSWFTSQEDASADDIAEIIKDDLWPNPLQCFQASKHPDESEEDDDPNDSGNLNSKDDSVVLLDDTHDDEVEYISSEDDEEEQSWQGGKGTLTQYIVPDDDGEDDGEYEDFEEEEGDVTGSSGAAAVPNSYEQKSKDEIINIDDDYLGSEDDEEEEGEDEPEYLEGAVDLDDKLLQGQIVNNDFEDSKDTEGEEQGHAPGEAEVLSAADSNHEANEDSRQSNGVVGSSTSVDEDSAPGHEPDVVDVVGKSKLQEQSKVVSTTAESDTADGGT